MTTYAALTDGTTTITFASPGTLGWYRIETGWTPKVAGLRQNQLGGRGPYEDVTEEIPVSIGGSNAAHMYANMRGLQDLLWKSNRWYRDENVAAVLFKYSPEGATTSTAASPLQAAVWSSALDLSGGFSGVPQSGSAVWTSGATLRFSRNGAWLYASASASAAGSNGSPVLVTLASTAYDSPTKVTVTNSWYGENTYGLQTFLLVSDSASGITVINAESGSNSYFTSYWSNVADTTNYALGSSVATFAGSDGPGVYSGSLSGISSSPKQYAVLVNFKHNYAASPYQMWVRLKTDATFGGSAATNRIYPPVAASYRQWINFGVVGVNFPVTGWDLICSANLGASVNVSVDSVVLADLENTQIVSFSRNFSSYVASLSTYSTEQIVLDDRYLTKYGAQISASSGYPVNYNGDPFVSTQGGSLYCLLLSNGGGSSGATNNRWRSTDATAGSSVLSNTWNITRYSAYLTPE